MVYCHEKKIVFIHIPKTGGTSVERCLNLVDRKKGFGIVKDKARQHFIYRDYIKHLGKSTLNNYFTFSIVRHPYSKLISEYFHLRKLGYKSGRNMDKFIDYVENIVKNKKFSKTIYHDHFIPQHKFIAKNNKILVDKLFKFEKILILKKYIHQNYNTILPHLNKRKFKIKINLTQSQKNRIYNIYKKDFILFGYKK